MPDIQEISIGSTGGMTSERRLSEDVGRIMLLQVRPSRKDGVEIQTYLPHAAKKGLACFA